MAGEDYDAFVSYGHGDAEWVHALARNLERLGLHIFLDAWELAAGDLIAIQLQKGLARAGAVVFVVSAQSVGRGWVNEEVAAAVAAAATGRQRLIPVLTGEVALPPFVASRLYIDFRHLDDPGGYESKVRELAAAIHGQPNSVRPAAGEGIVVPPGIYRAEGPRLARLRITADEVMFSTSVAEVLHRPAGLDARGRAVLTELAVSRARPGGAPLRAVAAGMAQGGMHAALVQAGAALGRCFLDGAAGQALAAEVASAEAGNAALRLALDVADAGLAALPWETLTLPEQVTPLVLQDRVEVYRTAVLAHPPTAVQVRGPLRILAVITSPDSGGGELLDYEAELAAIISAVNPARRAEGAHVEVLNWGNLGAIRAALLASRFHILHLSCHARPGALLLEDAAGRAELVSAGRFASAGLPADRGVPLVVLAGCSTAIAPHWGNADLGTESPAPSMEDSGPDRQADVAGGQAAAQTAHALEGLAQELLGRGVPAVMAMTAPVTDRYATTFTAQVYRELAGREDPVPLAAVSDARRAVEAARRALPPADQWSGVAEWATPVLVQAGPAQALFRRADGAEQLGAPAAPVFGAGMVVRRVGGFVGRRAELRELLRVVRGGGAGVVVHGIGGVGKSTLAAQLIEQLGADRGLVVAVNAAGSLTVDLVLEALRTRLLAYAMTEDLVDRDPLRQVAATLLDARPPWQQRLELVRQVVLPEVPVLLLMDNAEDLLTADSDGQELADPDLAGFLAAWVQAAPQARLVGTSRYPFALPGGMARRLRWHHLGPLSLAETRKLIWRLPALDALPPGDQHRAYTMVGGHPRTLEYLDALLRGGDAVFPDVADRLATALAQRGIADPQRWLEGVQGDLDRALAETITLAANDMLLDGLLTRLQGSPPARELIGRLAVYRRPVDETGVAWQLSQLTTVPEPSAGLLARLEPVRAVLRQARQDGTATSVEDLGLDPAALARYRDDTAELEQPPVTLTGEARQALGLLTDLGLAAPVTGQSSGGQPRGPDLFVHRWTAAALETRASATELTDAHRKAATYWRWRVEVWPQSRAEAVEQLLEARFHHHAAGDLDDALDANTQACRQLRTWGAWTSERHLQEEALGWIAPRSRPAADIRFELGVLAQQRGDYDIAEQHYHAALTIFEELGDRVGIAVTAQLGNLAVLRGDYNTAEQHYHAALAIFEELGDGTNMATTYHQLGNVAQRRGNYDTAEQHSRMALLIDKELGDRPGIAASYGQLGNVAFRRNDYPTAEQHYHAALAIFEELGDRVGIANAYQQLGILAQASGDFDTAEQRYYAALMIKEEIGERAGIAMALGQLGVLAQQRNDYDTAEQRFRAAMATFEELGDQTHIAITHHQLGKLAHDHGDHGIAEQHYHASLANKAATGDRDGTATTLSQFGVLRADQGRPADAIRFQLQSLAIRTELRSPASAASVHLLRQQRATLGDQQFQNILRPLMDNDDREVARIMQLTDHAG
jgi:tetratricopeptide (TPR) repeat protein